MTRDRRDVVAKADKQRTFKRAGNATLLVNIVASWLTVDSGSVLDRWVAARGVSTVPSSTKVRYLTYYEVAVYPCTATVSSRAYLTKPGGEPLAGTGRVAWRAWYWWYLEETCGSHAGQGYSTVS